MSESSEKIVELVTELSPKTLRSQTPVLGPNIILNL